MKRILAVTGVVVASLVLGGLALGWLLLPSLSSSEIRQAVARDIGRSLDFSGPARLSVWPELAIELRDVELSNPAGMFEGRFAAAEAVRLKVTAQSLWRQEIKVSELTAVRPRINLVVDSEGLSNFGFEPSGGESGTAAQTLPPIVIVDGEVTYLNERSGAAFAASNVDATISQAGLDGPLELTGAFNWNEQRSTMTLYAASPARLTADGSPADFTITSPHLSAAFSGRAALRDGLELAGTVDFTAHSIGDLLSWAGRATSRTGGLPALTASGSLDLSGGAIRIKAGQLGFGRMNAQGDLAVSFAGARPHIAANLGVDSIDLDVFAGDVFEGEAPFGLASGWSDAAFDLEFLKILDAQLSLAVSEIVHGKLVAGPSRLDVGLTDGTLDAALVDTELYGGSASGRLRLGGSGAVASLSGTLKAEGIDGGKVIAALFGPAFIRGKADIELDLAAKGANQSELASMLEGQAHLSFGEGALIELDIPALLGHLETDVAHGWTAAAGQETPFSALEASFTIDDGIAETRDLSLRGPLAEVAATGSIDVLRLRLDLKARPRTVDQKPDSGEQAPTQVPVAVAIEGSWWAPTIYRILEDPADASGLDLAPETIDKDPSEAPATR